VIRRPQHRRFSYRHPRLDGSARPPAIDRAIKAVREDIPPLPPGIDKRVLGPIKRECDIQNTPLRAVRALRQTGLWLTGLATLACIVAVTFVSGGAVPEPEQAVASMAFTSSCSTTSRNTDDGRQSVDGEQRARRVLVAGPWTGIEAARFRKVLERFSQKTGVHVVYAYPRRDVGVTREIAVTIRERVIRRCPPDVAVLPQPGLLRDLAEHGHLKPIEQSTQRLVSKNLAPFWRDQGRVNGTLYGVMFTAANKSTFWYSRRLFDAAAVTAPATWFGLQQVAAKLRARGIVPFSVAGADGWTLTDWFENVYLRTAGPKRYDALAHQRLAWTDDTVHTALRRLWEILGRPQWLAGGHSPALMKTDYENSINRVFSARPTAAIVYEGDFVRSRIASAQAGDAAVFAFPAINGSPPSTVVGGDQAAVLTNNHAGQRLVRFLATVEAADVWARTGRISPSRRLNPHVYVNPTTRRFAQSLIDAKATRFDLSDLLPPAFGASPHQGMAKILKDYLRGTSSIDAVTRKLQASARITGDSRAMTSLRAPARRGSARGKP
jgi:alpha-glucoside transport system substrate-binding protein